MFRIYIVSILIQSLIFVIVVLAWTRLVGDISLFFLQTVASLSLMWFIMAPLAKEYLLFTTLNYISEPCKCIETWFSPTFFLLLLLFSERAHILHFFVGLLTDAEAVSFWMLFISFKVTGDSVLSRCCLFSFSLTNNLLGSFFANSKVRSLLLVQSRHANWGG